MSFAISIFKTMYKNIGKILFFLLLYVNLAYSLPVGLYVYPSGFKEIGIIYGHMGS